MEPALTTDLNAGGNELNAMLGKCFRLLALSGLSVAFIMPFGSARATDYPMDLNGYCKSIGRSGVTNSNNTGYGWHCQPGNMDIVAQNVCNWQYGSGSGLAARLLSPPPGRPNDWVCQGQLAAAPPAPPGPSYSGAGREIHVTFCYAAGGMDPHWRLTVRDRLTQRPTSQEMTPGACMTVGLLASGAGYGNVTISGHGEDYDISLLGDGEKMDLY